MGQNFTPTHAVIITVVAILGVLAIITECVRRRKTDSAVTEIGFSRLASRQFESILGSHKFTCLSSRFSSTATSEHFKGTYQGLNACIFTITTGRSAGRLAVLLKGTASKLPHFIVRSKSFSGEVGDMLGLRKHDPLYPSPLIDKYDVISDDSTATAALLTSQVVNHFVAEEGVEVEACGGDLLIHTTLRVVPDNYQVAIQQAYTLAGLLGIVEATK